MPDAKSLVNQVGSFKDAVKYAGDEYDRSKRNVIGYMDLLTNERFPFLGLFSPAYKSMSDTGKRSLVKANPVMKTMVSADLEAEVYNQFVAPINFELHKVTGGTSRDVTGSTTLADVNKVPITLTEMKIHLKSSIGLSEGDSLNFPQIKLIGQIKSIAAYTVPTADTQTSADLETVIVTMYLQYDGNSHTAIVDLDETIAAPETAANFVVPATVDVEKMEGGKADGSTYADGISRQFQGYSNFLQYMHKTTSIGEIADKIRRRVTGKNEWQNQKRGLLIDFQRSKSVTMLVGRKRVVDPATNLTKSSRIVNSLESTRSGYNENDILYMDGLANLSGDGTSTTGTLSWVSLQNVVVELMKGTEKNKIFVICGQEVLNAVSNIQQSQNRIHNLENHRYGTKVSQVMTTVGDLYLMADEFMSKAPRKGMMMAFEPSQINKHHLEGFEMHSVDDVSLPNRIAKTMAIRCLETITVKNIESVTTVVGIAA